MATIKNLITPATSRAAARTLASSTGGKVLDRGDVVNRWAVKHDYSFSLRGCVAATGVVLNRPDEVIITDKRTVEVFKKRSIQNSYSKQAA